MTILNQQPPQVTNVAGIESHHNNQETQNVIDEQLLKQQQKEAANNMTKTIYHHQQNDRRRSVHIESGAQTRRRGPGRSAGLLANCFLLTLFALFCEPYFRRASATGVFEFELLNLDRLDKTALAGPHQHQRQRGAGARSILVHVCLKEAFASQLDGPCAYGNLTLTLDMNRATRNTTDEHQQLAQAPPPLPAPNATVVMANDDDQNSTGNTLTVASDLHQEQHQDGNEQDDRDDDNEEAQQRLGSQMTNIVRMPFTFRWTKSFTIILTAEEINAPGLSTTAGPTAEFTRLKMPPAPATNGSSNETTTGTKQQQDHLSSRPPPLLSFNGSELTTANQYKSSSLPSTTAHRLAASAPTLIDRHILTENGVVPVSGLNSSRPWIVRSSRSSKLSIRYKFRVSCAAQYYGDGCMSFCRPRDDQFGHYSCSSTGQKVCEDGWMGKDCNVARCKQGCNQQHGYCDQPGVCHCRPGWTGARCDECIAYPGCQNGYCLSPWQCVCHKNWGGVLCDQDLDYCGSHEPCLNNGTCQNVGPARYKCACPSGFTGAKCEVKLSSLVDLTGSLTQLSAGCVLNPCLNGGTCFGFNSQLTAAAMTTTTTMPSAGGAEQQNQSSTSSSVEVFEGNPQANNKQQHLAAPIYRCQCPSGWTGDFCQWAEPPEPATWPPPDLNLSSTATSSPASDDLGPFTDDFVARQEHDLYQHHHYHHQHNSNTSSSAKINVTLTPVDPMIELNPRPTHQTTSHVPMGHLISGVVVASAIGVFCASLMLAWCCLVAIERGRFHFIQMNIIRHDNDDSRYDGSSLATTTNDQANNNHQSNNVSSTLRRVHEKIRDSFKRSSRSNRIKPETKLSIENCLRPPASPSKMPPSYEESNYYSVNKICGTQIDLGQQSKNGAITLDLKEPAYTRMQIVYGGGGGNINNNNNNNNTGTDLKLSSYPSPNSLSSSNSSLPVHKESLVKRGALEQEIAQTKSLHRYHRDTVIEKATITNAQMNCPKHGHLYRSGLIGAIDHHQHHRHHDRQARSQNICPLPRKTSPDRV